MADTEFEQFRQYFDKLPQYIKAPPQCYTLLPNIDLDAESPTNPGGQLIPSIQVPSPHNILTDTTAANRISQQHGSSTSLCPNSLQKCQDPSRQFDDSLADEPFACDLQLVSNEHEECRSRNTLHCVDPRVVPSTRKRRKLPEVPKRSQAKEITSKRADKWTPPVRTKPLSLAEELFNAEHNSLPPQQHCVKAAENASNHNQSLCCMNCSQTSDSAISITESSPQSSNTSNKYYNASNNDRPLFLLKYNNHGTSSHDDESSSDSEKYPSFDSGHSTVHSDDGLKQYSSQLLSSAHGSFSPTSPVTCQVSASHLDLLESTHRGLHKFIPRHHDEIEIDIGDPIYVQREADDLWCEGVNLRSGLQGIFPSAYVVDVEYNDFDPSTNKVKMERYVVNYLGSIETLYHKGNEVLCQAVKKIASQDNYVATHARACILEISDQGIHMVDKGKLVPNHVPCHDYFYALKNVSFCGFHPNDHRYFCFVTKHPTLNRFACHVFMSQDSTRPVAEAVGRAFQRFYQKFLETAYPIEDIYLE